MPESLEVFSRPSPPDRVWPRLMSQDQLLTRASTFVSTLDSILIP